MNQRLDRKPKGWDLYSVSRAAKDGTLFILHDRGGGNIELEVLSTSRDYVSPIAFPDDLTGALRKAGKLAGQHHGGWWP